MFKGKTEYSKRVRSKYLLNYYSKVCKDKNSGFNNRISKDTYWFINSQNQGIKPISHYSKLNDSKNLNKFEVNTNLSENNKNDINK